MEQIVENIQSSGKKGKLIDTPQRSPVVKIAGDKTVDELHKSSIQFIDQQNSSGNEQKDRILLVQASPREQSFRLNQEFTSSTNSLKLKELAVKQEIISPEISQFLQDFSERQGVADPEILGDKQDLEVRKEDSSPLEFKDVQDLKVTSTFSTLNLARTTFEKHSQSYYLNIKTAQINSDLKKEWLKITTCQMRSNVPQKYFSVEKNLLYFKNCEGSLSVYNAAENNCFDSKLSPSHVTIRKGQIFFTSRTDDFSTIFQMPISDLQQIEQSINESNWKKVVDLSVIQSDRSKDVWQELCQCGIISRNTMLTAREDHAQSEDKLERITQFDFFDDGKIAVFYSIPKNGLYQVTIHEKNRLSADEPWPTVSEKVVDFNFPVNLKFFKVINGYCHMIVEKDAESIESKIQEIKENKVTEQLWLHYGIECDGKSELINKFSKNPMPFSFENRLVILKQSEGDEELLVYDKNQVMKKVDLNLKPDQFSSLQTIFQSEERINSINHCGQAQIIFQQGYAEIDSDFNIIFQKLQPHDYRVIDLKDFYFYEQFIDTTIACNKIQSKNEEELKVPELKSNRPSSLCSIKDALLIETGNKELLFIPRFPSPNNGLGRVKILSHRICHNEYIVIQKLINEQLWFFFYDKNLNPKFEIISQSSCLDYEGFWQQPSFIEKFSKILAKAEDGRLMLLDPSTDSKATECYKPVFVTKQYRYYVSPCENFLILVDKSKIEFCKLAEKGEYRYDKQNFVYNEIQHIEKGKIIVSVEFMKDPEVILIFYADGVYEMQNIFAFEFAQQINSETSVVDAIKIHGRAHYLHEDRIIVFNNQIIDTDYNRAAEIDFALTENSDVYFALVDQKLLATQPNAKENLIKVKDLSKFILIHFKDKASKVFFNDDFDKLTKELKGKKAMQLYQIVRFLADEENVQDVIVFPEAYNMLHFAFTQQDTSMMKNFLDRGTLVGKSIGGRTLLSFINFEGNIQDKAHFLKLIANYADQKKSFHKNTHFKDVIDTNCNQTAAALAEAMVPLERKKIYCNKNYTKSEFEKQDNYFNNMHSSIKKVDQEYFIRTFPPYSSPNDEKVTELSESDQLKAEVETVQNLDFYTQKYLQRRGEKLLQIGMTNLGVFGFFIIIGYIVCLVYLGIYAYYNPDPTESYWSDGLSLPETTRQAVVDKLKGGENEILLQDVFNVHTTYVTFFVWAFWTFISPIIACACSICTIWICSCENRINKIFFAVVNGFTICSCTISAFVLFVCGMIWRWGDMGISTTTQGITRDPEMSEEQWEKYANEMILQHGLQIKSGVFINAILIFFCALFGLLFLYFLLYILSQVADELPVQYQKCEILIPEPNSQESLNLKESLQRSHISEIFSTFVVQCYVDDAFGRIFFAAYIQSLTWVVLLGFLILQFWKTQEQHILLCEKLYQDSDQKNLQSQCTQERYWWTLEKQEKYRWIPLSIAFIGLIFEALQLMIERTKYFKGYNLADTITLIVIIYVLMIQNKDKNKPGDQYFDALVQLMFLMLWMLIILKYMTIFGPLRFFIKMVTETLASILVFLVVLSMFIFAYGHSLSLCYPEKGYQEVAMSAYVLGFGELDENFSGLRYMNTFIFIFYTVIITIQLLNLLIALLSDKYEEVMEKKPEFMARAKLEKCLEFENLNIYCKSKKTNSINTQYYYMYVKCKVPEENDDWNGHEWVGMFGKLSRQIKNVKKTLEIQGKTLIEIKRLIEEKK